MKRFSLMALSVLAVAALAPQLRADTIYSDNFDGTAGDLGGRPVTVSPGIDGGTAAATWNATASSANVTPITATGSADAAWLQPPAAPIPSPAAPPPPSARWAPGRMLILSPILTLPFHTPGRLGFMISI